MAGQVDEITASLYTKSHQIHQIPRFALNDQVVLQTTQNDKSGGGYQKKQNSHQEKLTNESYSSLRNLSAEGSDNKTVDNSQSANVTISKNNSYFAVLPRRQNQPIRQSQKSSRLLPFIPPPSQIHQWRVGANPPANTTISNSSSITIRCIRAQPPKDTSMFASTLKMLCPTTSSSKKAVPTTRIHNDASRNDGSGALQFQQHNGSSFVVHSIAIRLICYIVIIIAKYSFSRSSFTHTIKYKEP